MIREWLFSPLTVTQVKSHVEELAFSDGEARVTMSELIIAHAPEFQDHYTDSLSKVLFNGHVQTCYTGVKSFDNIDLVYYKRYIVNYPDGGEAAIDFVRSQDAVNTTVTDTLPYQNQKPFQVPLDRHYSYASPDDPHLASTDNKPLLIVCHGLTGGSHESYIRPILAELTSKGDDDDDAAQFTACVINSRGCCQSKITTPQLYNGGWTNDVRFCVKKLREMYPNRAFYMMGFSLGASIVTNYIGEEGEDSDIKCAIVLGTPWDLLESARYIDSTLVGSRLYSPTLKNNLIKLVENHRDILLEDPVFKEKYTTSLHTLTSVRGFDDLFTGPMFGYRDATDYYVDASPKRRLAGIRTPFISINAQDDPIVGGDIVPEDLIRANPYTMVIQTSQGGHLGWFTDTSGHRWYTKPVCNLLTAFHREITLKHRIPTNRVKLPPVPDVRTTIRRD